jgi:hypothetical protein
MVVVPCRAATVGSVLSGRNEHRGGLGRFGRGLSR